MAKEKKVRTKAVKKQRTEKKKGFGISIRTQLFVGFLIPMVLVVAVGAFAYQKASEGMLSNY